MTLLQVLPSLSLNVHISTIIGFGPSISASLFNEFMFHDQFMLRNPTQFAISSVPFGWEQGRTHWGKRNRQSLENVLTTQRNIYFFPIFKKRKCQALRETCFRVNGPRDGAFTQVKLTKKVLLGALGCVMQLGDRVERDKGPLKGWGSCSEV